MFQVTKVTLRMINLTPTLGCIPKHGHLTVPMFIAIHYTVGNLEGIIWFCFQTGPSCLEYT